MKKIFLFLLVMGISIITIITALKKNYVEPSTLMNLKAEYSKKDSSSVDHTKFASLQKKFKTPQDVTEACIACHNRSDIEIMHSNHWNWEKEEYIQGRGIVKIGKKNVINNFCIGATGNEESCAKCHIGYGMTAKGFSYTDPKNIDCMVCHDNTETYMKASEKGGAPVMTLDFENIARHIGKPKRTNCGVCHFFGGGGNNVKHGDLEQALFEPSKELDVHMAIENKNMQCVSCHKTEKHVIKGRMYSLSSMNQNRVLCEDCHTGTPHDQDILNEHTLKVACQTCHIPEYAKANSTKLAWDWSTAGKLKNGEPYEEDDSLGNHTYLSIKGSFVWGRNVKPDYVWFNGTASHYLLGDKIDDTTKPFLLNKFNGSYSDEESKIVPVKIHRAKQPYDPVNKMLIQPRLFAEKKGEGAFWQDFDWVKASETGMQTVHLPFSGVVTFINTEMYWPVNHMVASKDKAVQCNECHTRNDGRLAKLKDMYLPGRDSSGFVETAGKSILLITLIGVISHGSLRIISRKKLMKRGVK
jgi:octaheme c-type cytochrome (tetrathionate reductase family)